MDAINLAAQIPQVELYAFTPIATELRFEKWDKVLAEPSPPKALILDTAFDLYAKGTALAAKGDVAGAAAELRELNAVVALSDFSRYAAASMPAKPMAEMGSLLLAGEIARAKGDLSAAVEHFRAAYQLQLNLPYTEPPWWHQPVAHVLGAALLQAGRAAEAEAVYRESLKSYRDDGWALFGLSQALDAQGKHDEAAHVRGEFETAWARADVKLTSSRSPA